MGRTQRLVIGWGVGVAVAAGLAGCAGKPPPQPAAVAVPTPSTPRSTVSAPVPAPLPLSHQQMIANALIELNNGEVGTARVGLVELLAATPDDPAATDLLKQIDTDPKVLLGDRFFIYRLRPHETLSSVAKHFLGNSSRFWALARYNDIAVPARTPAGITIRVPGDPPVRASRPVKPVPPAAVPAVPERAPAPEPDRPAASTEPSAADIAQANRLRSAGLDQMTRGSIDQAVVLLARAATLNPRDGAIAADLARARKVQAAVRH